MMERRELSTQAELIHQLDPEPVFGYLLQHRALDQSTVDVIRSEEKLADRNVKLLQHLEELGNPAVELFINALRQSGQLHLASTLDVEHRIKPVHGKGYWEKQRYKGQITISFQLVAAKVMVRKDSDEDTSPKIDDINAMLTPFKVKHSYENMTLIGEEDSGPRARKILEYSYEEEDEKSRRCCWCCIPFFCCGKSKKKKGQQVKSAIAMEVVSTKTLNGADLNKTGSNNSLDFYDVMVSLPAQPSSPIKSGSTFFKAKKPSPVVEVISDLESPSVESQRSFDTKSYNQTNEALSSLSEDNIQVDLEPSDQQSPNRPDSEKMDPKKNKTKGKKRNKSDSDAEYKTNGKLSVEKVNLRNKENTEPCLIEDDKNHVKNVNGLKKKTRQNKSPPKSLDTKEIKYGMKRSETYELVERWKSEGLAYRTARDQFFSFFDANVQGQIIRYFEQERSTLVLQVNLDDKMSLCTICMTTREVKKLCEDYEMGVLHEDLVRCVSPQNMVDKMECSAIHLRTVINEEDFVLSFQELT